MSEVLQKTRWVSKHNGENVFFQPPLSPPNKTRHNLMFYVHGLYSITLLIQLPYLSSIFS